MQSFEDVGKPRSRAVSPPRKDDAHDLDGEPKTQEPAPPAPEPEEHLVCWLPPFHPAFVGTSGPEKAQQAAE